MKSLNAYAHGSELEGRRLGKEQVRQAVEDTILARSKLISAASPGTRSEATYTKAVAAVDGLVLRAKLVGITVQ